MTPQFSDGQVLNAAALNQGFDDLMKGLGPWDASGNTYPSTGSGSNPVGTVLFGNYWFVSVAGTLGTQAVNPGDMIVAAVDNPGQVQANWNIYPKPLGYVPQQQSAALTQITTAGAATASTFWAMASTGALALKSITDSALSWIASVTGFTGTGNIGVKQTSPTLITPNLGVPSAVDLTNASTPTTPAGINISGNAGTATTAGSATTAGTSTNLAGGAANRIAVQTASGTTGFVAAPTVAGQVLAWIGGALTWTAGATLSAANVFTNQQAVTPYRANISGAVSIDLSATAKSNTLILTLTGNVTSFTLTNPVDGACYNIWLIENGTGGFTFAGLDASFKFGGGAGTTAFATAANARNLISATYGATEGVYLSGFTPGLS